MTTYLRDSMTVRNKLEANKIDNQGSRRYKITELVSGDINATFAYDVIETDRVIVVDMYETAETTINLPHPAENSGRIIKIFELGNLDVTHKLLVKTPVGHALGWTPLEYEQVVPVHLVCICDGVNWDVFAMPRAPL